MKLLDKDGHELIESIGMLDSLPLAKLLKLSNYCINELHKDPGNEGTFAIYQIVNELIGEKLT